MAVRIDFEHIIAVVERARAKGRDSLLEHEVYSLLKNSGAESVPGWVFVPSHDVEAGMQRALAELPGPRLVLKIVSPDIIHKTEAGGVRVVDRAKAVETARSMLRKVREGFAALTGTTPDQVAILGLLAVEFMPPDSEAFGNELLVSLRRTDEFGTVLTAGLGGTDTELYAERFRKGQAVVAASVELTTAEEFFQLFKRTIAYRKLAGLTRGQERIVTDAQLLDCFASFMEMGRAFGPPEPDADPDSWPPFVMDELEVNPFAFSGLKMMPLDGLCRVSAPEAAPGPRPVRLVDRLLHPQTIGIIGVSATRKNFGRIILENVLGRGFAPDQITIVRPGAEPGQTIDGVACAPDLAAMGEVDLFILAVSSDKAPAILEELTDSGLARAVILIPGGLEEREGGRETAQRMRQRLEAAHRNGRGPVVLGGNSLGVLSHPGHVDTIFVPDAKLPQKTGGGRGNVAFVSQSGGFLVTMASKLTAVDPAYMLSIGNQTDLTAADLAQHLAELDHVKVIAIYMEGFKPLDGLALCRAVRRAVARGKEVVFYKAGRTPEGRTATSGHTASVAGDYMVCESLLTQSGAMVADTFSQFEDLYLLAALFHGKQVRGLQLAGLSGAGFEAVGMADSVRGDTFRLNMAELSGQTAMALEKLFEKAGLGSLVAVTNPLDINPAADDRLHVDAARILAADPGVDAVVVGLDPLSPAMRTLPDGMSEHDTVASEHSIAKLFPALVAATDKPMVAVVDAGRLYDALVRMLADGGVPVFRTCDRAVAALAKYMQGRLAAHQLRQPPEAVQ